MHATSIHSSSIHSLAKNNHPNAWSCDHQDPSMPGACGWVVSNNAAAEKLVRRLLLQATHVAISLYRQRLLSFLLIIHAAVTRPALLLRCPSVHSLHRRTRSRPPPRPPFISRIGRVASYPYSVTTRCCVTPESPAASTCQSRAFEPHLGFPTLLLLATYFVERTAFNFADA
jgi:hypothetical protein